MIVTPFLPHQQEAFDWLKDKDRAALFMPLGSGKSLVALAMAERVGAKRILITSDKNNTLNTWPDQVWRHTDWENVVVRPDLLAADPGVVCVNYDYLKTRAHVYSQARWDMWIGDESTEFKNPRTRRTQALRRVVERIPHRIILSGEPCTERLEDIFGQMLCLDDGEALGASITRFRRRFLQPDRFGYGWEMRRNSMTDLRRAVSHLAYWPEPGQIQVDMPTAEYHLVQIPMTPKQEELDRSLRFDFEAILDDRVLDVKYAVAVFMKRLQLASGIFRYGEGAHEYEVVCRKKLDMAVDVVKANQGAKIVFWAHFIPEYEELVKALASLPGPILRYASPTDTWELEQFRAAEAGVLVARSSLGKGLNQLADADVTVFFSNGPSYAQRAQIEGRSRRISSTTTTTHYIDLVTKGGADEYVYGLLSNKQSMALTLSGLSDSI